MSVCINLPAELEASLRNLLVDLDSAAKEACLVEFYRQGQLTHHQLASALSLDRYSTDGVLKRHGVGYDLSADELQEQIKVLTEKN